MRENRPHAHPRIAVLCGAWMAGLGELVMLQCWRWRERLRRAR